MIVQGCGQCRWVTKHPNAQPVESPEVVANRELMKSKKFPLIEDTRHYCDVMQTTFRKDFPDWGYLGRPPIARLPPLGPIIQKDERCLDWVGTETKNSFDLTGYEKPEIVDGYEKYFGTNFRFNEDIRTSSYEPMTASTHRRLKVAEFADDFDRKALYRSTILRGDRTHLLPDVSHYRDAFREGAKSRPPVHGGYVSGPTLLGDARENDWVTTSRAAYRKLSDTRCPPVRPPEEADVWTASKFPHPSTIFQSDFRRHGDDDTSTIYVEGMRLHADNRERNLRANYVYQDGGCDMDRYRKSISTCDFHSLIPDASRPKLGPDFHVQSHLIFGDVDRVNGTTETSTYIHDYDPKMSPGYQPSTYNGQISSVKLGDENILEYKTTSGEHAKFDPSKAERAEPPVSLQASSLPLDLYPGPVGPSTYTNDFQRANQCKLELNEERLREMKQSNFHEHKDDRFCFGSTEYHDHFVRKQGGGVADVQETIRRNRRSSVPLGTIPQCD